MPVKKNYILLLLNNPKLSDCLHRNEVKENRKKKNIRFKYQRNVYTSNEKSEIKYINIREIKKEKSLIY